MFPLIVCQNDNSQTERAQSGAENGETAHTDEPGHGTKCHS